MKLEDHIRAAIRRRAYSPRTETAYVDWYRRFVRFHHLRHPAQMGAAEVEQFLTHLALDQQVSGATQNQAFSALLFLYREVLNKDLGEIRSVRAQRTRYVQPYLSHAECLSILSHLSGVHRLVLSLIYVGGLRLLEALRLRVKDVDLDNKLVTVHDAKSNRDRVTFLPDDAEFVEPFKQHLERVRREHETAPHIPASMPLALERKYRSAAKSWEWQYVFPARDVAYDKRTQTIRRHHLHETGVQRVFAQAVKKAGITKKATVHTLRAAFAHRMRESGLDLDEIQKLMGHADPRATAHYLEGAPPPHAKAKRITLK